ncbi:MAG: amino acid permease [Halanaeroarchaeum sp.]
MTDQELAKDLGPLAALTIGVGTMIGAGIFVLPGPAVARAGPLVAVSFVLGGAIALLTALSASELGTAMPRAGGAYYYVNHALGPLFGSIAGWANWMGLAFASAFYMYGFGQYVGEFLAVPGLSLGPLVLPPAKVIALFGAAFFVGVNYVGAKETGRLQNGIVITLVLILAGFTILGAFEADLSTLRPIAPFGYAPLLPTTGLIFVSFLGFVQITSVAEEIKAPGRNLPRAVIGSVLIVTLIYALVLVVLLAVVETPVVANNETAVVDVASRLAGPVGAAALLFGGLLATASSANASILASSRINFAMGRDGIVSPWLNEVHERFATPYRSIGLTGVFILAFIVFGDVETLATAGSVLHLLIYGLLNVALIVMREVSPADYQPDYRVPLYPATPIVGAIISFALIGFIEPLIILLSGAFVVFAVLWYVFYARSRSGTTGVVRTALRRRQAGPSTTQTAASVEVDGGDHRVLVPLANPETVDDLVTLGAAIARANSGTLVAVHIVQVPDQTTLSYAMEHSDEFSFETGETLEVAETVAADRGVDVETHTIFSHRGFEEIFDAARTHDADTVVMGWSADQHGSPGRAETAVDELAHDLPADFLVLKDRGFDPDRILVPTAGGPDSDLSAVVASILRAEYGASVTLLHVAEDEELGEAFLADWAESHDLGDAELVVEVGTDIEAAIERNADDATLLIVGATERGLLSRLVRGSLVLDVVEDVDCSVLLAETKTERSFWNRLIG